MATLKVSEDLSASPTILLDTHVHLHRCFDPADFLDNARENFRAAAREAGWTNIIGGLWLTDTPEERSFRRLSRASVVGERWSVRCGRRASSWTSGP